ncbi:MAG: hypothetical protein BZY80_03425 [SAR202 cluster bacterium Io17-Chloro-G2]|nr:MAG: hypothetical protein BZY80_03425 [SAR202 cluster bacterium Io17-Chloro-G2]
MTPAIMPAAAVLRSLWGGKSRTILGICFASAIGLWVARDVEWGTLTTQLNHLSLGYTLLSLFLFCLAMALRVFRWQVLFLGEKVPFHRLLLVQNAGIGLNSLSPVRVFGEAAQFVLLTLRYSVKREVAVATLGIQRVLDFVIGGLLLGVGLVFVPALQGFTLYILGFIAVAILSLVAVPLVIWSKGVPWLNRIPLLVSTAGSLRGLMCARSKLASSLVLTLGYWLLLGLSAWVLAFGMGIEISVLVATLLIVGTMGFVGLIPSLPASVGTFEFAVYHLLKVFGVGPAEALGFGLVVHAIIFIPPIVIAVMVFGSWPFKTRAA